MKITMKDIKDNTLVGVVTGLAVTGVLYIINRNYIDEIKASSESTVRLDQTNYNIVKDELTDLRESKNEPQDK